MTAKVHERQSCHRCQGTGGIGLWGGTIAGCPTCQRDNGGRQLTRYRYTREGVEDVETGVIYPR